MVVGASVGIAIAPSDGDHPDQLLKNADMALYRAKSDGRRLYRVFEREMDARLQARRALELDLRKALADGQFELFYQPLIDLRTETISGCEALLRWNHPGRGLVSPAEFIPLAEEIGLIVPLGEWVLREACLEAAKWPRRMKVAVNLSPAQFKRRNLAPAVVRALSASALAANRLELEITESVLLLEDDATVKTLHLLRGLGVRISMDDFGTGYSSAQLPAQLPVRQDQDRPLLRARPRREGGLRRDRARRRRPRREPRHHDDRRGRRDGRAARAGARPRLHRSPGLSLLPAAPGLRPARRLRRAGGARAARSAA